MSDDRWAGLMNGDDMMPVGEPFESGGHLIEKVFDFYTDDPEFQGKPKAWKDQVRKDVIGLIQNTFVAAMDKALDSFEPAQWNSIRPGQ